MENQIMVELLDFKGSDYLIAEAAWVSNGRTEKRPYDDYVRVLKMISKYGHTSCYEHVVFTFNIEAPLYILNQITRHRINSFNQASRRYQYPFNSFYDIHNMDEIPADLRIEYEHICKLGLNLYKKARESLKSDENYKRIMEVISGALPLATMSRLTMTSNLRSWLNFYKLRSDSHAQNEIRIVANKMRDLLEKTNKINIVLGLELCK